VENVMMKKVLKHFLSSEEQIKNKIRVIEPIFDSDLTLTKAKKIVFCFVLKMDEENERESVI
jgi:hypothetical protein